MLFNLLEGGVPFFAPTIPELVSKLQRKGEIEVKISNNFNPLFRRIVNLCLGYNLQNRPNAQIIHILSSLCLYLEEQKIDFSNLKTVLTIISKLRIFRNEYITIVLYLLQKHKFEISEILINIVESLNLALITLLKSSKSNNKFIE